MRKRTGQAIELARGLDCEDVLRWAASALPEEQFDFLSDALTRATEDPERRAFFVEFEKSRATLQRYAEAFVARGMAHKDSFFPSPGARRANLFVLDFNPALLTERASVTPAAQSAFDLAAPSRQIEEAGDKVTPLREIGETVDMIFNSTTLAHLSYKGERYGIFQFLSAFRWGKRAKGLNKDGGEYTTKVNIGPNQLTLCVSNRYGLPAGIDDIPALFVVMTFMREAALRGSLGHDGDVPRASIDDAIATLDLGQIAMELGYSDKAAHRRSVLAQLQRWQHTYFSVRTFYAPRGLERNVILKRQTKSWRFLPTLDRDDDITSSGVVPQKICVSLDPVIFKSLLRNTNILSIHKEFLKATANGKSATWKALYLYCRRAVQHNYDGLRLTFDKLCEELYSLASRQELGRMLRQLCEQEDPHRTGMFYLPGYTVYYQLKPVALLIKANENDKIVGRRRALLVGDEGKLGHDSEA